MDAAINMINEFMPEGRLIVYTEGKSFPRSDVYANGTGTCKDAPIVVLTDEISASASEIFSERSKITTGVRLSDEERMAKVWYKLKCH